MLPLSRTILKVQTRLFHRLFVHRKINQQYVYGDISQIEALQEAQLQVYTPNTKFWWRLAELVYAHMMLPFDIPSIEQPPVKVLPCVQLHALFCPIHSASRLPELDRNASWRHHVQSQRTVVLRWFTAGRHTIGPWLEWGWGPQWHG